MSRQPTASCEEQLLGQNRARELNRITNLFILRRTQDVNNQYLPPRGLLLCWSFQLQLVNICNQYMCVCLLKVYGCWVRGTLSGSNSGIALAGITRIQVGISLKYGQIQGICHNFCGYQLHTMLEGKVRVSECNHL